ncbi:hypothetical protein KSP40_PGU002110 [Platanthera guangdongensis]|uniref:F-box domain-containing protein n=1 Tax=Platanthera guangdongensis TaxID=2320717 RepID=A0ABR2MNL4_9ASPA
MTTGKRKRISELLTAEVEKMAAAPEWGSPETAEESEEMKGRSLGRDPLEVLGPDILLMVMKLVDACSAALSASVSRGWNRVVASDHLWGPLCEELFKGKAHIPRSSMFRGAKKLAVYSMSMIDAKRKRIVKEDLCDHVWEFHFKMSAPEYWLNLDPWWRGLGPPMRRYFHPDGSQTADPGDLVWGGHECAFSIVTSYVGEEGRIRRHYVRINRWEEMTVSRREDWSWEMANQLCCYNSIPDSHKVGTGPFFPVC